MVSNPSHIRTEHFLAVFVRKQKIILVSRNTANPDLLFLTRETTIPTRFSRIKKHVAWHRSWSFSKPTFSEADQFIVTSLNDGYCMTYVEHSGSRTNLIIGSSSDGLSWKTIGSIKSHAVASALIAHPNPERGYLLYSGHDGISLTTTQSFKRWTKAEQVMTLRPGFFDHKPIRILTATSTDKGILIIYDASYQENDIAKNQIGAALFSKENPENVIWRSTSPLWESDQTSVADHMSCIGAVVRAEHIFVYWQSKKGLSVITIRAPFSNDQIDQTKKLQRHYNNPILSPVAEHDWESQGVFNPAAIKDDADQIHLLYRAIGADGVSRIGHTCSNDGVHFDERNSSPIFAIANPRNKQTLPKKFNPKLYPSGGSWGGCEDPRLVRIDGRIYLTFNAFDGWNHIRIGVTSIDEQDFFNKFWNWSETFLISPPGQVNKNWVLFPEKINGKFALLHSLSPEIQIDYVDTLEELAAGQKVIKSHFTQNKTKKGWDTWVRGAGSPPLKTKHGWLVLYHANEAKNAHQYKIGALLLDLENPQKIIARSTEPILAPDMWYENDWKPGIVYTCGALIKDNTLFVYYGGGDKHVCAATMPLEELFDKLLKNTTSAFDPKKVFVVY